MSCVVLCVQGELRVARACCACAWHYSFVYVVSDCVQHNITEQQTIYLASLKCLASCRDPVLTAT
jgi:hypothetical protein